MTSSRKINQPNTYGYVISLKNDEFSDGRTDLTISNRNDLDEERHYCGGAYDAKAISAKEFLSSNKKIIHLIYGPTRNDYIPQFNWNNSTSCENSSHVGLPEIPAFDWITYTNQYDF